MFSLHFLCVTIIVFIACFVGWLLQKTIRKVTVQSGIQLDPRTSYSYRPVWLTSTVAWNIVQCAHPENDEANIHTYEFHKRNEMYGLCQRVDELKTCERDEDAEQILVDPYNFAGPSYTRIQCQCPVDEMTGSSATTEIAGTTTDSSEAKTIYHFTCGFGGFDEAMDKRGRYYGGSNRRKFYFYK